MSSTTIKTVDHAIPRSEAPLSSVPSIKAFSSYLNFIVRILDDIPDGIKQMIPKEEVVEYYVHRLSAWASTSSKINALGISKKLLEDKLVPTSLSSHETMARVFKSFLHATHATKKLYDHTDPHLDLIKWWLVVCKIFIGTVRISSAIIGKEKGDKPMLNLEFFHLIFSVFKVTMNFTDFVFNKLDTSRAKKSEILRNIKLIHSVSKLILIINKYKIGCLTRFKFYESTYNVVALAAPPNRRNGGNLSTSQDKSSHKDGVPENFSSPHQDLIESSDTIKNDQ